MIKRIFHSICFVALAVFLASIVLVMGVLYAYFSGVQWKQLKIQTTLAAQGVSHEGMAYFDKLETKDYRITWIGTDGTVLYDSKSGSAEMENHMEREEIQKAFLTGYGESRRYSVTLMEDALYCAQALEDGTVLRLSVAQSTIFTLILGMMQPICLVFAIAVALSVFLAIRLSKNVVEPLNELNLDKPLENKGYDELAPLLRRLDSQQRQLRFQAMVLQQKQNELDTIISSMNEGMVLLNQKGRIISINPAAMRLLNTDRACVREDIWVINRNLALQEALENALNGVPSERKIELCNGCYQVAASPIRSDGAVTGAALLLFDVTEKEKAEQLRREFTANVSHELKTPLQSISGYAELLKHSMVKSEDIVPFAERIYAEAGRMVQLVEDIISLSHLDEGADDMQPEAVDLYALAEATLGSLEHEAKAAGVSLELSGETAILQGIPQLLDGILHNLCDNAIKYNRKGGTVSVDVTDEEKSVLLSVSDTGIGIAGEHQERIFERFYRVDKSHSKEVGGTGLGLSIVKHAAKIHNAKIELCSVVGEGTAITVRFPKLVS